MSHVQSFDDAVGLVAFIGFMALLTFLWSRMDWPLDRPPEADDDDSPSGR